MAVSQQSPRVSPQSLAPVPSTTLSTAYAGYETSALLNMPRSDTTEMDSTDAAKSAENVRLDIDLENIQSILDMSNDKIVVSDDSNQSSNTFLSSESKSNPGLSFPHQPTESLLKDHLIFSSEKFSAPSLEDVITSPKDLVTVSPEDFIRFTPEVTLPSEDATNTPLFEPIINDFPAAFYGNWKDNVSRYESCSVSEIGEPCSEIDSDSGQYTLPEVRATDFPVLIDAPTQPPRYLSPSLTTRRELPSVFGKLNDLKRPSLIALNDGHKGSDGPTLGTNPTAERPPGVYQSDTEEDVRFNPPCRPSHARRRHRVSSATARRELPFRLGELQNLKRPWSLAERDSDGPTSDSNTTENETISNRRHRTLAGHISREAQQLTNIAGPSGVDLTKIEESDQPECAQPVTSENFRGRKAEPPLRNQLAGSSNGNMEEDILPDSRSHGVQPVSPVHSPVPLDPALKDEDKIEALISHLRALFGNKNEYKKLLDCRLLDIVVKPPPGFQRHLIVATQRLAATSGLYPTFYELTNVTISKTSESSGGFADIYKGDFRGQEVCIKMVRLYKNTDMAHFMKVVSREAILWGQLRHPNLLPFYGIYSHDDRVSFVAPWMENGDINEYLKRNQTSNRVVLTYDVAQGLEFLHENGIIHGDLKGPNILVNKAGRAHLADFGIASISDKEILAWTSLSTTGSKGGTVRWQALELFDPESDEEIRNTKASDIWAWACVAYEVRWLHFLAHQKRV
ncbi:hypothetical protein C0995_006105 [Termitomyces sp. Mi166|nr:hypothetical protein C0995_006105 [Termitomyces sp. Mi166\